ncbi:MAG: hypothetical protein ABI539_04815, partial [Acidobacteriota bacterium]
IMDWLADAWSTLTPAQVVIGILIFVGSIALNILVIAVVFVKIPPHYFGKHYQDDFLPNARWLTRWGAVVGKNVAGVVMILIGIIQLVGPGQGILSILTGLILLDIPGKRPWEARIIRRPAILTAVNRLRARYNRPPLEMD